MTAWKRLPGALFAVGLVASCGSDRPAPIGEAPGSDLLDGSVGDAGFASCATATVTAVRAPADLYVMVDYSESMGMPAGSTDRWTAVTGALRSFITAPESAGVGVGIQYFALYKPLVQGIGASCDPRDYASPDVEIGELPGGQAELLASIDEHAFPRTMTPIGPALQGAIDHARAWAGAHPSHSVSVVLATDGEPSECTPMSVSEIASDIAAPGAKGRPRVLTFVVGVGDLGALDAIAQAGGTDHAYLATGTELEAELLAALDAIRTASIPCAFELPTAASGQIEPSLVNVTWSKLPGAAPRTIVAVADSEACGSALGWYYDDPAAPSRIELCPATCSEVDGSPAGRIDVVIGCRTVIAPPR